MEYGHFGKAAVKVSRLCIGAGVRGEPDEDRLDGVSQWSPPGL
jgi:hypothetical protein